MLTELGQLTWSFFKVGILAYGGGPSMIPLIQEEVVDVHQWMTIEEFTDALAMGYALPGPIACKMAGIVGIQVAGIPGVIVANVAIVLPSLVAMLLLMSMFLQFKDSPLVAGTLKAVRPAVVGLLLVVVWEMFPRAVTNMSTGVISAATFGVIAFLGLHPAWAIVAAGMIGLAAYR